MKDEPDGAIDLDAEQRRDRVPEVAEPVPLADLVRTPRQPRGQQRRAFA